MRLMDPTVTLSGRHTNLTFHGLNRNLASMDFDGKNTDPIIFIRGATAATPTPDAIAAAPAPPPLTLEAASRSERSKGDLRSRCGGDALRLAKNWSPLRSFSTSVPNWSHTLPTQPVANWTVVLAAVLGGSTNVGICNGWVLSGATAVKMAMVGPRWRY